MTWRIALLGTYHPAVPTLEQLVERGWISVVIMPEDTGDKNAKLMQICRTRGVPFSFDLGDIEHHDVNLVLAANYPKLVPAEVLDKYPCINTHWSALPKYRGVHGTAWALLNADYRIGCTVHWMERAFDEGDVLAQEFVTMTADMDINGLHELLAEKQAEAVICLLDEKLHSGRWRGNPQDHLRATYVPQRLPEDGIIDWSWPTERIWNFVRALPAPKYPGAFTFLDNRKLIVWKARPAECPSYFCTSGQVVRVRKGIGVWVKTGDTCLEVEEVEIEGSGMGKQPAEVVLKRGTKLGYNPQVEIARLRQKVAELERQIADTQHAH